MKHPDTPKTPAPHYFVPRRVLAPLLLLLALVTANPSATPAHPLAPSALELSVHPDNTVTALFRTPVLQPSGSPAFALIPAQCREHGAPVVTQDASARTTTRTLRCGDSDPLALPWGVGNLAENGTNALLTVRTGTTPPRQALLHENRTTIRPASMHGEAGGIRNAAGVLAYLRFGLEHIAGGTDHLAFVAALLVLLGPTRRLILSLTAFTAGHAVTLALGAAGLLPTPGAVVEVAIALSVVLVSAEALVIRSGAATPTVEGNRREYREAQQGDLWRDKSVPWVRNGLFGLLHGAGFAGAMLEAGLPEEGLLPALLGFNVGIELGQFAFVAMLLFGAATVHRAVAMLAGERWPTARRGLSAVPSAAMVVTGVLAGYWSSERILGLF